MLLWCGTASSACGILSLLRLLLCSADFCVVDCSRKFSAFFSVKTSVSLWCLYCSASVVVAAFCACDCSLFSVGQDLPEFFVFCLLCPIPAGFRLGILLCVLRGLCCSEQVLRVCLLCFWSAHQFLGLHAFFFCIWLIISLFHLVAYHTPSGRRLTSISCSFLSSSTSFFFFKGKTIEYTLYRFV